MTISNKPQAGDPLIEIVNKGAATATFQQFLDELTELVNELQAENEDLKARVDALENP